MHDLKYNVGDMLIVFMMLCSYGTDYGYLRVSILEFELVPTIIGQVAAF
jgi:hypothetical protein